MRPNIYLKWTFTFAIFFCSCLYKAGNRKSDLNISVPTSINTFYIDNYLRERWMKAAYKSPLNSELVNYPKDFVPLTDSLNKLKYVIELRVSGDSLHNNGWGLILSSIYSFEKKNWINDRDSLLNKELDNFKLFFKDSVLIKTVEYYRNKIPDSILFIGNLNEIKIRELK